LSEKYSYLAIDFLCLAFPLLFSFSRKNNFFKKWKFAAPAILLPAVLFIAEDAWFTEMGIWGFNQRYITGIYFFHLPIEEILFFICIPYACLFSYESIGLLSEKDRIGLKIHKPISSTLAVALLITGVGNVTKWYTSITFLSLAFFFILLRWVWKAAYMGKFYFAFCFILIPFFAINGILTGTAIVWYNDKETLGFRLGAIPVEDIFYGMLLILMNVSIFEYAQKKNSISEVSP